MRKETVRGREMYDDVTTEEMISVLKQAPSREIECSSFGRTRWVKYDKWHSRIGITDNIYYDWYTMREFRKYYHDEVWHHSLLHLLQCCSSKIDSMIVKN